MSVIPGEGRVSILYGNQAMAVPPHRDGYLARPDTVSAHPAVALAVGGEITPAARTLARALARYGYAVVVPPGGARHLAAAVDALGDAWSDWSRRDRRAVIGVGAGAAEAAAVAMERGLALVLLDPDVAPLIPPEVAVLTLTGGEGGGGGGGGRRVTYRGVSRGFWDDSAVGYHPVAAADALRRIIGFLDRQLGDAAAA